MESFSKVLVTGGAGFIGSHLVDALMNRGFFVRVLDDLSHGDLKNLDSWFDDSRFDFVEGDLKDSEVACKSVKGVDLVFHFAANPDVRLGESDPSVHFNENLLVTFNVLEAMRKSKTAKKIVFASSSTVYGEPGVFPTPEDYQPLLPISLYGASKLGCESLISSYCYTFDLRGIVLRFANIVGSRAKHGVIVDFVRKLEQNPVSLEVLGDGEQEKSYLHVSDLVSAVFVGLGVFDASKPLEIFNVGSLDQVDVKRIAEIVCEEMGLQNVKINLTGGVDGGRGWKGDVKTMLLSSGKLSSLGWKPRLNSEEAVRQCCRELLNSQIVDRS
jgi:UDP-glucose 4-epimerase